MPTKHSWKFKPRLRCRAFGWKGSRLACQRLKEAVSEIKKVARVDPVTAGDGVVSLMERIWPAFQDIDTSSGTLGGAVYWAQRSCCRSRSRLPRTERLGTGGWTGSGKRSRKTASITSPSSRIGGASCAAPLTLPLIGRTSLSACFGRPGPTRGRETTCRGTSVCLSSLLAAGRHQELLEVLALQRFPFWHDRKFGVQALLAEGRTDEALAYAEASRGLNQPDASIDAACEKILLDIGRAHEAYEKYALTANASSTGLATFRAIVKKYPGHDPKKILLDLATSSGDPGRWFAAAKDAGFLDLALEFAKTGRTDPRTLSRASRDLLKKDARFSWRWAGSPSSESWKGTATN